MHKGYVDTSWGQIHYREQSGDDVTGPALVLLHATAYSGRTFAPIMPALARSRRVIALDTPGYGGSDGPPVRPNFEAYGRVLVEAVRALCGSGPVDLFGFHTGALLATEMAASEAALFRKLVLIGIPFFEGDEKARWREKLVHPTTLDESFEQFRDRWDYFIVHRTPGLSLERAFECFVDEIGVYPREWWAHEALFDYRAEDRLPLVRSEVLVINPETALAAASSRAAARMPSARVHAMPESGGAIFDLGANRLVMAIDDFCGDHAR